MDVTNQISLSLFSTPGYHAHVDGTWLIRTAALGELRARVAKLNKRGAKTGGQSLDIEVIERAALTRDERLAGVVITRTLDVAHIRITGWVPAVSDHAFLARIEHHPVGNIVARAPGRGAAELPEELRTARATCDHCDLDRRRNETFVLRAPSGELKRIGRNCLADFLRTEDAVNALRVWDLVRKEIIASGDDEYGLSGGSRTSLDTEHYLTAVCACIRMCGWTSKARSAAVDRPPTSAQAFGVLGPKPQNPARAKEWLEMQPIAADRAEAADVVAWGAELATRTGLVDYLHNLRVALALPYLGVKNAGLVASAVAACRKDREMAIKATERAARPVGAHVGKVGERIELELTVVRVRSGSSDWGATTILALEDAAGNELVWFANGNKPYAAGDRVRGKATIKCHGDFKGRPQTTLTRAAFELVTAQAGAGEAS